MSEIAVPKRRRFAAITELGKNGTEATETGMVPTDEIPKTRYDMIAFLGDLMEVNPVVVFMKGTIKEPRCGHSLRMVRALEASGLGSFVTVDVSGSALLAETVKEISLCKTFPQLFLTGKFEGNADQSVELLRSGELVRKLKAAGLQLTEKININDATDGGPPA